MIYKYAFAFQDFIVNHVAQDLDASLRIKLSSCLFLFRTCIIFACVDKVEIKPNQVRLGEHCDYGTITLVFQLDSEGLQVGFIYYK